MNFQKTLFSAIAGVLISLNCYAADTYTPVRRLKSGFFPSSLTAAFAAYQNKDLVKCLESVNQIKITPYTNEPEKYFLLKALCSPKESQPAAAFENVSQALREKGSSSDILFAAAIILSQVGIDAPAIAPTPVPTPEGAFATVAPTAVPQVGANEEALKRYQEAIWFGSFKKFDEEDFYLDYGTFQYKLSMYGEANESLTKAVNLGATSIDAKFMLTDIAIRRSDRKNAITLARQLKTLRDDVISKETLLLALMVSADPIYNKRDIAEAAQISQNLSDASIVKPDVGVAATKALMLTNNLSEANTILQKCLAANPTGQVLQALDTQIKAEYALTPVPTPDS